MANTFGFGGTIEASGIASAGSAQVAEEYDTRANNDPNKLLQCPFDKNHQIRAFRFPGHIIKCRKNHPKLAKELKTCPFNARHLVPKQELPHHIETCTDRISVDAENAAKTNGCCKWKVPVSTWENPNPTENWDEEADDDASPFILGQTTVLNDNFLHGPDKTPRTASARATFRTPNVLPWSNF